MAAAKAPHHPRAKKGQSTVTAVSKKEHAKIHNKVVPVSKKKPRTFRDADGKTNIERYNESLKGEKIVHKTTTEWAEIIKDREDARQARNKAEDALKVQIDRCIGYQKEIGELNRELWRKRAGAFLLGGGFAFIISYFIIHLS